ncbi:glycosyltransferase family 2 protein [Brevibacillus dissolubilis]|uniref:glycosyltransferase family 2 protein n=1 Tax=Brevibacillus dissolubilis TaxID=1844116 RepID=UPI0011167F1B|nr:glycosyltransferase family 2 protein [Brevibacillus dissolubilis]
MSKQLLYIVIPARNEEGAIGEVIRKTPRDFHPNIEVKIMVVDDGSTDQTVQVSLAAGADEIYTMPTNTGLGATVRTGLREAYNRGADYAVMIDADDEYPANEIPELVAPLISGEADYVMGSRFMGTIKGMKLHRRLGNYFFTSIQMLLLRRFIYDGQSGMRAFNRAALADLEIIHDYNYAQVMTLNLVRKGYRMKEIPIRYQVRTTGTSFIRFNAYMTRVFPAIWREMRRPVQRTQHVRR